MRVVPVCTGCLITFLLLPAPWHTAERGTIVAQSRLEFFHPLRSCSQKVWAFSFQLTDCDVLCSKLIRPDFLLSFILKDSFHPLKVFPPAFTQNNLNCHPSASRFTWIYKVAGNVFLLLELSDQWSKTQISSIPFLWLVIPTHLFLVCVSAQLDSWHFQNWSYNNTQKMLNIWNISWASIRDRQW